MGDSILKDCVRHDGGLYSPGWFLNWQVGDQKATLDGEFTVDELEAIALHMRRENAKRKENSG